MMSTYGWAIAPSQDVPSDWCISLARLHTGAAPWQWLTVHPNKARLRAEIGGHLKKEHCVICGRVPEQADMKEWSEQ
jgi:hypothetical protein